MTDNTNDDKGTEKKSGLLGQNSQDGNAADLEKKAPIAQAHSEVDEDTIDVTPTPEETDSTDSVVEQEAPETAEAITDTFNDVDPKEKKKDRTLNVLNEPSCDEELVKSLQTEEDRLLKLDPGEKAVEDFLGSIEAFQEILATLYKDMDFRGTFERASAEWINRVVGNKGKKISINHPKFSLDENSDRLEGLNAIRYLSSATGVGTVTRIPLWHSGIVLTVDAFRERRLLDLHETLVRQKMDIGTNTKGAAFTGDDVYTTTTIIDFILDHVIDTNLKDVVVSDVQELKNNILVSDIPALFAGALAAIYPRGYPIFHQCINTLNNSCDYAITAERTEDLGDYLPDKMLDFRKVLWVDQTRLETEDRIHMSAIKPTHSKVDITAYQKRVNNSEDTGQESEIFKNDEMAVSVRFKISTLTDYENICSEWCTRVSEMVDDTMLMDAGTNDKERMAARNEALNKYASTVNLLKQSNWIEHIKVVDRSKKERFITEAKTINSSLEVFGATDGFEETFNTAIQQFKENSSFAFTGLSNFTCPTCGSGQVAAGSKYPSLIPMNMVSYFFILTVWRNRTKSGTMGT